MGIEDELREIIRAEARAVFKEMFAECRTAPPQATSRYLTVKEAAYLSSHPEGTIRAWLHKGTLKNYGRHRAPRVRLSDILNLSAD